MIFGPEEWAEIDAFQDSMGAKYRRNDYYLAMFMEVAELVESTNWKPWKATVDDRENLKREIVDVMFFLHHVARRFGITPEELQEKYQDVMANNIKRYSQLKINNTK